ncbi:hypothetical protein HDU89_001934 [Geranomyces variabilis]|nr:hypothetical protein HDU89_001934 [Geranomyces variabilis]
MRAAYLLLTAVALAARNVSAQLSTHLPWSDCSTNNSAPIKVSSLRATYDKDAGSLYVVGQAITTIPLGNVPLGTPHLKNGTVQTTLEIVGFEAQGTNEDICTAVACPVLQPGTFQFNKTISIPINLPFVDWNPRISFLDGTEDANELMCVRVRLALISNNLSLVLIYASILVALSSGFTTIAFRFLRSSYEPTIYDLSSGWAPTARLLPSRVGPSITHVILFAQFLASTGQLNFQYPSAYQDFVRLLSWATGTWNVGFIRSFARTLRGGGLVVLSQQEADAKERTGASIIKIFGRQLTDASAAPQAFDGVSEGTALTGYERYAAMVGMSSNEMFLNTLIPFAICLILIVLAGTGLALVRAYFRRKTNTDCDIFAHEDDQAHHIRHYMGGWAVRTTILFYFGLTSTSLHQLTISNEPPAVQALAGIIFAAIGILVPLAMIVRLIGIARMNRNLEKKDPEYADEVYARSISGNIQNFRKASVSAASAAPTRAPTRSRDAVVEREAAEVYARMRALSTSSSAAPASRENSTRSRALSVASSSAGTEGPAHSLPFKPLRAFSVSSAATTATSASRSSAWPLPPLYLSQKFMLLYGPFFNNYDPSHFIAHAEFLIPFTWYLRFAPAIAIGILGKIAPPYLQFIVMISGDALLFFYLIWKSPFAGKAANRWQWFLAFCRAGMLMFVFVAFVFQHFWSVDWMAEMILGSVALSGLGVLGLFSASSGIKFLALTLKGFKRKTGARTVVATDPIHLHKPSSPDTPGGSTASTLPRTNGTIRRAASPTALSRSASSRTAHTRSVHFSDDDDDEEDRREQQQQKYQDQTEKRASSPLLRNAGPNPSSSAAASSSLPRPAAAVTKPAAANGANVYSEEDYFSRARAMKKASVNGKPTTASAVSSPSAAATAATSMAATPTRPQKPTRAPSNPGEMLEMHTVREENNPYFDV